MRNLASGIVLGLLVTFDGFMPPTVDTSTVSVTAVAVAVSDVFSDLPSGLRAGYSLDLLSTTESIDTSSVDSGKGAAAPHAYSLLPMGWSVMSTLTEVPKS